MSDWVKRQEHADRLYRELRKERERRLFESEEQKRQKEMEEYINRAKQFIHSEVMPMELPKGYTYADCIFDEMVEPQECQHDWADYVGFNRAFTYCTKCDEKKDEGDI